MAEDVLSQAVGPGPHGGPAPEPFVAALDGSPTRAPSLTWAAAAAVRHGARLDLVHVVEAGDHDDPVRHRRRRGAVVRRGARGPPPGARLEGLASTVRARHPGLEVACTCPSVRPAGGPRRPLRARATVVVGASAHDRARAPRPRVDRARGRGPRARHGRRRPRAAAAGGSAPGGRRGRRQRRRGPGPRARGRRGAASVGGAVTAVTAWTRRGRGRRRRHRAGHRAVGPGREPAGRGLPLAVARAGAARPDVPVEVRRAPTEARATTLLEVARRGGRRPRRRGPTRPRRLRRAAHGQRQPHGRAARRRCPVAVVH